MADGFVSKVGNDGLAAGVHWLDSSYAADERAPVQYLQFTDLEQPILHDHLLTLVKGVISGDEQLKVSLEADPKGLLLGTTTNAVAYLGAPVQRSQLRSDIESVLMDHITEDADFDCKTEWRSFDPDVLTELALGFEQKHEIIAEGYADTLARGSGTEHQFERIPDGFKAVLPELAHLVFNLKDFDMAFEGLSELPRLQEQVRESDEYNNQTWKIGYLGEILRRVTGSVDDGYDPETLDQELEIVRERVQPALEDLLEPEADACAEVIERFFAGGQASAETLPASDEMCFLCGRPATTDYQKGNDGFYGTSKFSRRVPPENLLVP
jgi:CRISPR-associated protein Csc3